MRKNKRQEKKYSSLVGFDHKVCTSTLLQLLLSLRRFLFTSHYPAVFNPASYTFDWDGETYYTKKYLFGPGFDPRSSRPNSKETLDALDRCHLTEGSYILPFQNFYHNIGQEMDYFWFVFSKTFSHFDLFTTTVSLSLSLSHSQTHSHTVSLTLAHTLSLSLSRLFIILLS